MGRLRKFLDLAPAEQRLLCGAALLLGAVRIALRLLPFRTVQRLLQRLSHPATNAPLPDYRIAWAVRTAARCLPGTGNCLVQALVGRMLLVRHGHSAELRIGVARTEDRRLEAHAWVECAGTVLLGATPQAGYTPLPAFDGAPR